MSREPRKPRLRRIDDASDLHQYEVSVDGVVLGIVAQERASTTHGYTDSRLGYRTTRTTWMWETPDNYGDYRLAHPGGMTVEQWEARKACQVLALGATR